MSSLTEPPLVLFAFILAKKFVFAELILVLALLRLAFGRGLSRIVAGLAALLAALICVTVFAPVLGLTGAALYPAAARTLAWGGGMTVLVALSALFWLSAVVPTRRATWIEPLHGLLALSLLGLWIAAML